MNAVARLAAIVPGSLTAIVADDTVSMIEWWHRHGVPTEISGDDLARVHRARYVEWHDEMQRGAGPVANVWLPKEARS